MRQVRCVAAFTIAALIWPHGVRAQQAAPQRSVHIRTLGGFLGSFEGSIEFPAGPWDTVHKRPESEDDRALASGGLIGASRWLTAHPAPDALLLVTGNNIPKESASEGAAPPERPLSPRHPFWIRLAALSPSAVALGPADFVRGLAGGAAPFTAFLRDAGAAHVPFVASNAIVREHGRGLNTVRSHKLTLEIAEDASLVPTDKLTVACAHACPPASIVKPTLEDLGPVIANEPAAPVDSSRSPGVKPGPHAHLKLDLDKTPLQFGRKYRLVLHDQNGEASFTFRTARALTPRPSSDQRLQGLPLAAGPAGEQDLPVLAFVDPELRLSIAPGSWSWKPADHGNDCAATSCEIDFLPPVDAFKAIHRLLPSGERRAFVVMLAVKADAVADLLSSTPDIRVLILPPDSSAVGRAADKTAEGVLPRLSGDLGYNALVNSGLGSEPMDALARQVWLRPEWAAETVQEATFSFQKDTDGIRLLAPVTRVEFIPGQPLRYSSTLVSGKAVIRYFVRADATDIHLNGDYPLYEKYGPDSKFRDGTPMNGVWTDAGVLTQFLLDVSRLMTASDVAVLNQDDLDEDVIEWLADEAAHAPDIPWLSRFFLERILYRHESLVKTSVAGSALAAFIDKVVGIAKQQGGTVCVAGIAAPCPMVKVDGDHLRVNEREIDASHFYAIALPRSIAVALGLKQHVSTPVDPLEQIDERFTQATEAVPDGCIGLTAETNDGCLAAVRRRAEPKRRELDTKSVADTAAESFEQRRAALTRWYAAIQPVSISGLARVVSGPPGQSFASVPVEGRDVKDERDIAISATADVAMDRVRYALRGTFKADYVSKTLDDVVSYPTDEWTAGLRGDLKIDRYVWHRVFVGAFRQSWFRSHQEKKITASREQDNVVTPDGLVLPKVTETGPSITPVAQRPVFTYGQAGVDFEPTPNAAPVRLKALSATFDAGRITRDRDGVQVGGTTSTLQDLLAQGAAALVNAEFSRDPAGFRANPVFQYEYRARNQTRAVVKGTVASNAARLWGDDKGEYSADFEYRHYFGERPPLTTRSSFELKMKFSQPVVGRVAIGPFFNWYIVSAGLSKTFRQRELGFEVQVPAFGAAGHLGRVLR